MKTNQTRYFLSCHIKRGELILAKVFSIAPDLTKVAITVFITTALNHCHCVLIKCKRRQWAIPFNDHTDVDGGQVNIYLG